MTSLADRTIAALRSSHDQLAALVPDLTDDQLSGPSGAAAWPVAQVLSHLGSGAEIAHAGYRAALDGTGAPADGFNEQVWERWNALAPREQAAGFLERNAALVETLEALTPQQRADLQIDLGFLPAPVPLASAAGMRLHEVAQHSWDVRVGVDPAATLDAEAAEVLVEHFADGLGFMLGFIGKADELASPAVVALESSGVALAIEDRVMVSRSTAGATATFSGEPEAAVRLIGGRLTPAHTPGNVEVTGNVTLDDLRRVFPGY